MKLIAGFLIMAVVLAGCAQKAKRVDKPVDFSLVKQTHAEEVRHVAAAAEHLRRASDAIEISRGSIGRAKMGVGYQEQKLAELAATLEKPLFKNPPPEMREIVDEVKAKIAELQKGIADVRKDVAVVESSTETAHTEVGNVKTEHMAAQVASEQHEKASAEAEGKSLQLFTTANGNADIANKNALALAKSQKREVIAWATAAAALLGCAVLGYLLLKP
jgi:chromosome segregation ATPase